MFIGQKTGERGRLVELVGDQSPGLGAPLSSKGDVRRGAMKKSRYVRVIERKEVKGDDPIEYFLITGVGSTF